MWPGAPRSSTTRSWFAPAGACTTTAASYSPICRPGFAAGVIPGGPFGVNQSPPYVNSQVCTAIGGFYEGFIPTCDPTHRTAALSTIPGEQRSVLLRPAIRPRSPPCCRMRRPSLKAAHHSSRLRDLQPRQQTALHHQPDARYPMAAAQRPRHRNRLRRQLGRHEVVPIPFNQAQIASPTNPDPWPEHTYGYTVDATATRYKQPLYGVSVLQLAINLPNGQPDST